MLVATLFNKEKNMSLTVNVKDNNIEQALRSMKKKLQREGLFKEMKLRKHYEKPSLKKLVKKKKISEDLEKLQDKDRTIS